MKVRSNSLSAHFQLCRWELPSPNHDPRSSDPWKQRPWIRSKRDKAAEERPRVRSKLSRVSNPKKGHEFVQQGLRTPCSLLRSHPSNEAIKDLETYQRRCPQDDAVCLIVRACPASCLSSHEVRGSREVKEWRGKERTLRQTLWKSACGVVLLQSGIIVLVARLLHAPQDRLAAGRPDTSHHRRHLVHHRPTSGRTWTGRILLQLAQLHLNGQNIIIFLLAIACHSCIFSASMAKLGLAGGSSIARAANLSHVSPLGSRVFAHSTTLGSAH